MSIAFRKVWRDLWNYKGRTLLVVLSIAVGVLALGLTTASNTFLKQQMELSRVGVHAAHARMVFAFPIGDEAVDAVSAMPQVEEAEGWLTAELRWKTALTEDWNEGTVLALADYANQKYDLLEWKSGAWPEENEIMVEDQQWQYYGVPPIGGTMYVEVNGNGVPLRVSGTLRDSTQSPPPFNPLNKPAFYINRATALRVIGTRDFNHLRFRVPDYSRPRVEAAVQAVEDKLTKLGATQAIETLSLAEFQDPEQVQAQAFLDGLTTILIIMAVFSMLLSVTLVINTINAIVAQQVTQIGIMKTIGGEYSQIVTLYLAGVLIYGFLSLLIAVPLGMAIGYGMARFWLLTINIPAGPFRFLPDVVGYQVLVGLLTPMAAALWPILQGVSISTREAIASYGLGRGHYGKGLLDRAVSRVQGIPRLAALSLRNTFRRAGRVLLTEVTLVAAGAIFMMVSTTGFSFISTFDTIWKAWAFDVLFVFSDFERVNKTEAALLANPAVERVEMWVWMQSTGHRVGESGPGQEWTVQLRGVPADTRMFNPALVSGRKLFPEDGHAIVLNQYLAQEMNLAVGDTIVLDLGGGREAEWTIVGTAFDIGVGGDQTTAFVPRDRLTNSLHRAGRATVAQVDTRLDTFEAQESVKQVMLDYFNAQGIDISFSIGQIENRRLASVLWDIIGGLLQLMTLLVAIVGSIGLSGTLSINVMERKREIGVMRAVGASSVDVGLIFMGEGLMLGGMSWALAVPLSMFGAQFFVKALGDALQFPFVYYYSVQGMWTWLAIIIVLAIVASWLPSRNATRISVRESLAYE